MAVFKGSVRSLKAVRGTDFELSNPAGSYAINAAWNGSAWTYISNGRAFLLQHDTVTGDLRAKTAAAGTAGATITWSDRASIGESGVFDGLNRVYSDSNPPESFEQTILSSTPASPPTGEAVSWTTDGKSLDMRASDGTITRIGPSAGSNPWSEQIRSTDWTNSTTTSTDVFTGFAPAANTNYLVDCLLMVFSVATTTGVQTALSGPTTGITRSAVKIQSPATTTTDMINHTALNVLQSAGGALTSPSLLVIQGIIMVGAAPNALNIRVTGRSELAGSNVTISAGSSMRWRTL